ncbi:sulfatase-like hydrolase/transferase, partial [Jiangella anatolica]
MSGRPNIVLIVMDDLGYGDLSCMGNRIVRTPRMDAVAAEGIVLRHMYAASAVCTPSRAALLTGRYPQRVG